MAETDALKDFEFPRKVGLFVQFEDGDEFKLRVLTTDPVVTNKEFEGDNGEVNISTKFAFIVYNFTLEKAQILNAGATITKRIQELHQDADWGANIKKIDIKVRATGNKLTRRYTVEALPKAEVLTNAQIKECQGIDLEKVVTDGQRMSFYKPSETRTIQADEDDSLGHPVTAPKKDDVIEDIGDEPINLDDIPF